MVAELFAMLGVESPASIEVSERGWHDPQTHRLLSKVALRTGPVHGLLGTGLVSLLRLFQGLFVPERRLVPVALARNGIPQLLERAKLLFPEHPFNRGRSHCFRV